MMCSEDIGVADNTIALPVSDLEMKAQRTHVKENLYITHAVIAMVRAKNTPSCFQQQMRFQLPPIMEKEMFQTKRIVATQ